MVALCMSTPTRMSIPDIVNNSDSLVHDLPAMRAAGRAAGHSENREWPGSWGWSKWPRVSAFLTWGRLGALVALRKFDTPPHELQAQKSSVPRTELEHMYWWRRGGIEPPVQERPLEASTGVVGALFSP